MSLEKSEITKQDYDEDRAESAHTVIYHFIPPQFTSQKLKNHLPKLLHFGALQGTH